MINKIIHFSDLHIRLFKDHDLYREIMTNALEEWKTHKPDRVVFTGDLVHSKNQMTPELILSLDEDTNGVPNLSYGYIWCRVSFEVYGPLMGFDPHAKQVYIQNHLHALLWARDSLTALTVRIIFTPFVVCERFAYATYGKLFTKNHLHAHLWDRDSLTLLMVRRYLFVRCLQIKS